MNNISKGKSPFYPGHPLPPELFVGRAEQIERVMTRGAGQVTLGKPVSIFIEGEYGIGKSSLASYLQNLAAIRCGLHPIYTPLGNTRSIEELGEKVLEAAFRSGALHPKTFEKIRNWLGKYIGEQSLFGLTLNMEALKKDAPSIASGMLPFLLEVYERIKDEDIKGIFLVLDEINGITANPQFAHFIKGLVDTNAVSPKRLPLLLMICGVKEKRWEMIAHHQPIDRIFDVIDIEPLSREEMETFFHKAFDSVGSSVDPEAMDVLVHFSAGLPKIMNLIGDYAYWLDQDDRIDRDEAFRAVISAADEVGKKYVDQQVYNALKSRDYHSILKKLGRMIPTSASFNKQEVEKTLTGAEKKKFNNFLQKMKTLKVLRSGLARGEYIFNMSMVQTYIWLKSQEN